MVCKYKVTKEDEENLFSTLLPRNSSGNTGVAADGTNFILEPNKDIRLDVFILVQLHFNLSCEAGTNIGAGDIYPLM